MPAETLSNCSLSCCSSASRVKARCWMTEKVPSTAQAMATVSESAMMRRAEIDRRRDIWHSLLRRKGPKTSLRNEYRNSTGRYPVRASEPAPRPELASTADGGALCEGLSRAHWARSLRSCTPAHRVRSSSHEHRPEAGDQLDQICLTGG